MENFRVVPAEGGNVVTYEKDGQRHLVYHARKIRRKKLQKLLSLLDDSLQEGKKREHQETLSCELIHVKRQSLLLERPGIFFHHYRYSFKPNYDSLIGILMLFSIGTTLLLLSLTMDYRQLSEIGFQAELKRSILPFGIIPGIIFEIGACIYTWFTSKTTYQEMKLLSCYRSRAISNSAEAFEIVLDNKYHKGYRLFKGVSVGICIDKEPTPLQQELLRLFHLERFLQEEVSQTSLPRPSARV
ncbi:MAG: hypothetical protein D6736_18300 [Nitrospinota bacterium]|nr:MAG: hypothetical protein D6736_18300 [Nitrospinota bacterium]